MATCYIASGFFNERQIGQVESIKRTLEAIGVDYYSPKDECVCTADAAPFDAKRILQENCNQIDTAKVVWINPDSNDMGTLFELGYAIARGKRVVYYEKPDSLTQALYERAKRNWQIERPAIIDTSNRSAVESIHAGYLYAQGCRIIYFCLGLPEGAKFNLMLSASGIAVCTTWRDLAECMAVAEADSNWSRPYTGLIE